ncbi:MAG: hypothetical protein PHR68_02950 [Candidatus Gracilibacteria bacterium]|nr:hypothetical protein [Candidatus Gracilibacteria bacterium]
MFGFGKGICECNLDISKLRSGGINQISNQGDKCNKCALADVKGGVKHKTSGIIGRLYAEEFMKELIKKK